MTSNSIANEACKLSRLSYELKLQVNAYIFPPDEARQSAAQKELILYCNELAEACCSIEQFILVREIGTGPLDRLQYQQDLGEFINAVAPFFEETKYSRILNITQTQGVLVPWARSIYQLLSQVVSAICGIITLCTWYPLNSVYKWMTSDPEPVFKYGVYGTFFSTKSLSEQALENIHQKWEDFDLCAQKLFDNKGGLGDRVLSQGLVS